MSSGARALTLLGLAAPLLAAALEPARLLEAPRPPGVTLDLEVRSGDQVHRGVLDLRFDADALRARLDLSEGPREGQRVLVLLSRSASADRFYAYRPALGLSPMRAAQLERLLVDVGVSVQDVAQLLYPERGGGAEGWSTEGDTLLAPPDAGGCQDRYEMGATPLPLAVELCPEEPWGARRLETAAPFTVGEATLPGRIEVRTDGGGAASVRLSLADAQTWDQSERFTREGLEAGAAVGPQ